MNVLRDLKRFIACKSRPDEAHEVLRTVLADAEKYAPEFGIEPERFMVALLRVDSDQVIVSMLLATIKGAEQRGRKQKAKGRALSASEAAQAIGQGVTWEGAGRAHLDMVALLASALTKATDLLVFRAEGFEVAIYMKPLLAFAKLKRANVTGFVDAEGLHLRWGSGGLNLCGQIDAEADRIVVALRMRADVVAA